MREFFRFLTLIFNLSHYIFSFLLLIIEFDFEFGNEFEFTLGNGCEFEIDNEFLFASEFGMASELYLRHCDFSCCQLRLADVFVAVTLNNP